MREILFRGKRNDDGGEWHYGGYIHDDSVEPDVHIIMEHRGGVFRCVPVLPETVGQFTGLTDKNGKRIFEGDILRHYNDSPYAGIEERGSVFWDEVFLCFRRTSNGGFHHGKVDTYRLSAKCDYEVIGDIYNNPELLEVSGDE